MNAPRALFEKLWDAHVVAPETADTPAIPYLVHEVTSPQVFDVPRAQGLKGRCPDRTLAILNHSTSTLPPDLKDKRPYATAEARAQLVRLVGSASDGAITQLDHTRSPTRQPRTETTEGVTA